MPTHLKGQVYKNNDKTGDDTWGRGMDRDHERGRVTAENRNEKDKRRNKVIRKTLGVANITDKIGDARSRWYAHVMRREDENCMKRIMMAEVTRLHSLQIF